MVRHLVQNILLQWPKVELKMQVLLKHNLVYHRFRMLCYFLIPLLLFRLHENLFFSFRKYILSFDCFISHSIRDTCSLHLSLNSTSISPLTSDGLLYRELNSLAHTSNTSDGSVTKVSPLRTLHGIFLFLFGTRLFTSFQNSVGLFPLK